MGQLVQVAVDGKSRLGVPISTHRLRPSIVGINTFGFIKDVWHPVQRRYGHHHDRRGCCSPGGVGPIVEDHQDIPEGQFSVSTATLSDVDDGWLSR